MSYYNKSRNHRRRIVATICAPFVAAIIVFFLQWFIVGSLDWSMGARGRMVLAWGLITAFAEMITWLTAMDDDY
jgi:hypothetical protein